MGLWRVNRRFITPALIAVLVLSFMLSLFIVSDFPEFNFYLLPSRAWEVMSGGLVAVYFHAGIPKIKLIVRNFFSLTGCFLIFGAFFIFDADTSYPSIYTLAPVVGTLLLIIFTDKETLIYGLLASRPLVLGGLVS